MTDADEAYQQQSLRSLFASGDYGEEDADAGSDDGIYEHAWTARRPNDGNGDNGAPTASIAIVGKLQINVTVEEKSEGGAASGPGPANAKEQP